MFIVSKYFIVATSVIIFLISLLFIDDNLNPEARGIYEETVSYSKSESYIYLMGLPVADKEPEIAGQALLKTIRETEDKYLNNPCSIIEGIEYPKTNEIPLLKLGSCGDNCDYVDKIFVTNLDIKTINDLQPLYKRYNKFMSFIEYRNLTLPTLSAPIPPYTYIMSGSDLINYMAIAKAKNMEREDATTLLLKNISNLRLRLQQADTLIDKVVYVVAISRSIDVLSVLKHKNQAFGVKLEPLTIEERSLVLAINYEFSLQYSFLKAIDGCPELHTKDFPKIPSMLSRLVYKPNITINSIYPLFKKVANRSLLNDIEFIKEVKLESEFKPKNSKLRNYVGSVLSQIAPPDYNQYIAKIFSLDAKIKLYNLTIEKMELPKDVKHISNPFYNDKTAFYSQDEKSICFDMNLVKKKDDRCLRVR